MSIGIEAKSIGIRVIPVYFEPIPIDIRSIPIRITAIPVYSATENTVDLLHKPATAAHPSRSRTNHTASQTRRQHHAFPEDRTTNHRPGPEDDQRIYKQSELPRAADLAN
jgi:hypothetical protein